MPKENSLIARICDYVAKYSIYVLVALLPIFFLPWTSDILDFNKQTLLLLLSALSLFAWMLKSVISKQISINLSKIHIAVVVFFVFSLLSTIFSLWRYGSFWGWPQVVSESLVGLIGLIVFYFLVSNIFNKKEIYNLVLILAFSGFLALIFGCLQIFGLFLLPLAFTKATAFNTIGAAGALGLLAVVFLPLVISLLTKRKALAAILFWAVIFTLVLIVALNFLVLWWLVIVGSALIIIFGMQKKSSFDSRWLILPMFFLALSLFFVVLRPAVNILSSAPAEFSLSQKASLDIVLQTLKASPIFGSGPGTFVYDFSKYIGADFNASMFWNVKFGGAGSKFLTVLGTTGILGALSFLFLMFITIFQGIKVFLAKKNNDEHWNVTLGVIAAFMVLSVGYFLYNSAFVLDFLYFFLIAVFIALTSKERKQYPLESSSVMALSVTFIFTLCFIFGLGLLILTGQKYIAEINYTAGLTQLQKGNGDEGIKNIEKAASLNPSSDLYFRQLSQLYLSKVKQEAQRTDNSQEERGKNIQMLVANSINASKIATDINSKNDSNWAVRGLIYQNLIGLVPDSESWAIKAYDSAMELAPNNPYYPTQKGIVFLNQALSLPQDKAGEKASLLSQAEEQLSKAILLKSDYAPARFQMAMVSQAAGKTDEAISRLEDTRNYAPQDVGLALQLGLLYYQSKDYQGAQGEFERAVGISPNYSNALYFLGLTYYELGQNAKAIDSIQKVVDLNPADETIKKVLNNLKSGNKPLEGIGQEIPAPVEEAPAAK
ncbi:MAG: tetratricopeptide repeat protein [Candidatus Staskawiczbacteria bacterium]|jgi:tetratricopeptide (TPR) repeat protein